MLISTQSSAFVSCFDPEHIVVVERDGQSSTLTRPDGAALEAWMEDYSLGEIWEKTSSAAGRISARTSPNGWRGSKALMRSED